jgi:hypothetical protein
VKKKNLQLLSGLMDVLGEQLLVEAGPPQRVQELRADHIMELERKKKIDSGESHTRETAGSERCSGTGEDVREGSGTRVLTMGCGSGDTKG